jgi:hypothetical protein
MKYNLQLSMPKINEAMPAEEQTPQINSAGNSIHTIEMH